MGAAGLTCSSFEMASRGGHRHRARSRPRAAARDRHDAVRDPALRVAGAHAARRAQRAARRRSWTSSRSGISTPRVIGRVTDDGRMRVRWHGETVVDIPVEPLAASCAGLRAPARASPRTSTIAPAARPRDRCRSSAIRRARCSRCSSSPNLCSREWVYRQYDQLVGGDDGRPARRRRRGRARARAPSTASR